MSYGFSEASFAKYERQKLEEAGEVKDAGHGVSYALTEYSTKLRTQKDGTPFLHLKIWGGKRSKPDYDYLVRSAEKADEVVESYVESAKDAVKRKAEAKKTAKKQSSEFSDQIKVGTVLYSSWGYDQTNVNFYKVIARTKCTVTLVEVYGQVARRERGADYVTAGGSPKGEPFKRRIGAHSVRISDCQRGYIDNGKEHYETAAGYGH
jgi:hypothetical protein